MVEQASSVSRKSKMQSNANEISQDALKSPSMLKTTMDKEANKMDARSQMTGDPKNPFRFIEAALNEAKSKIERMKNTPQILESLPDEDKKKKFLKAENKLLRENLKRMSDNVNILIEKMNQESMRKAPAAPTTGGGGGTSVAGGDAQSRMGGTVSVQGPLQTQDGHGGGGAVTVNDNRSSVGAGLVNRTTNNASPHGGRSYKSAYNRTTIAEKELQNTDKAIVNLMKEHNKLKKRLELIQQPDFLINLKKDLKTTEEEIKQQEKLKRQLKVDQLRREKKLDQIIDQSEPDVLRQVQDTTQRLAFLTEKLAKLEEDNRKAEELRNQQIDQLAELRTRLDKLNKIAEHYGVSIEKSKENQVEHKKLTEQLEYLNKQKRILTQAIDTQTRKQEALTAEKRRDLEQLQMRKGEILAKYNERVVELREKGLQIKDLIERAKTEADDSLQEILDKWQTANDRILEKYPEGSQMSFAQLEEAAKEQMDAQRERDGKKKAQAKTAAAYQRDDEMQVYLSDIRQMQEQIIQKMQMDRQKSQVVDEDDDRDDGAQSSNIDESVQSKAIVERKQPSGLNTRPKKGQKANAYKAPVPQPKRVAKGPAPKKNEGNDELSRLKAELEREKQEKQKLAQQVVETKRQEELDRKKAEERAEEERQKIRKQEEEIREEKRRLEREAEEKRLAEEEAIKRAQQEEYERQVAEQERLEQERLEQEKLEEERQLKIKEDEEAEALRKQKEEEEARKAAEEAEKNKQSAIGSKPNFLSSKPKIGGGAGASAAGNGFEGGQEVPQKLYHPGGQSSTSVGSLNNKPLSFLDRARLAKKQNENEQTQLTNQTNEQVLNKIAEENQKARSDSVERKRNDEPKVDLSVPNTFSPIEEKQPEIKPSGYQPSANAQSGYQPSQISQPRRRRVGDDAEEKKDEPKPSSFGSRPQMRGPPSSDPFAKFDNYDPLKNLNSNPSQNTNLIKPVQQPAPEAKKDLTFDDKLANERQQSSFMDKITSNNNVPAAAASQPKEPEIQFKKATIGGGPRPAMKMNINQSTTAAKPQAPPANKNLVASLDDLEDLE